MPTRMDEITSQGMGKLKAVKARLGGLVGVFNTLAEQHGTVASLLRRVQHDPDKRADLWPKIRKELISHERAELDSVYPELAIHAETRAFCVEHQQEADDLDALIAELHATDLGSDTWGVLFDQLVEMVVHHADEEEKQIFPVAQKVIGHDRARELDTLYHSAKTQIAGSF